MKSRLAITLLTVLVQPGLAQRGQVSPVPIPDNVELRPDIVYCRGGGRDLKLDLFLPKTRPPRVPGVIFIHGGGWRGGSRGQFHRQAAHVASTLGYVGAAIEYRLSGEAKFPAAVEDAKCAVRWLRANASAFGVDSNRIAAAGGSAGGHLAAMLGVTDRAAGLEGDGGHAPFSSRVNAVVAFNGVFDLTGARQTPAGAEAVGGFLGASSAEQPDLYKKASPLAHVDRASAPFLLLHGTADTTVSIEQSRVMLKRLTDAGVDAALEETEGAAHGYFNSPPHYQPALERMVAFLKTQFERSRAEQAPARPRPNAPNVLFIAVDDLRPEGRAFSNASPVETPNIDRLARRGTTFHRAYVQQAVCSPSRTSLLTGRRPDTTRVYDLQTHFRLTIPDVITLPQLFKNHGYHTQGLSKIFHSGLDDPASWSAPHWDPSAREYGDPAIRAGLEAERERRRAAGETVAPEVIERDASGLALKLRAPARRVLGPAWEAPDVPDSALRDGQTADKAIALLQDYRAKTQPFFLAVGLLKPHLPFVAPKRYFDRYPLSAVRLPSNNKEPENAPRIALTNWGELRGYRGMPEQGPLDETKARELIRAYYAAASYTDAQIGRVLDALDRLGLRDNTIVVLWGDHGWHLGEQGLWCKHTNFENATRAPLIVSAPRQKRPGAASNALVEFVDVFPTLAELAGLPRPEGLEGTSVVPLLSAPDRPWKSAAFSQYPRGKGMGYSLRTDRYRYTEWSEGGQRVAHELYDHGSDPGETRNIADAPNQQATVRALAEQLRAGWRRALPPTN